MWKKLSLTTRKHVSLPWRVASKEACLLVAQGPLQQMYIHAYRHIPDPDRVEYARCVLKPYKDIWNQMLLQICRRLYC